MISRKLWRKIYKSNKNGAITGAALIVIALTQIPGAINNAAQVFCIGQASNQIWKKESNHSEANMRAVSRCNGRITIIRSN